MKDRTATIILCLFVGGLGIHRFYLGQPGLGLLYLLFCWTLIPSFIAFFELFVFIFTSDDEFNRKFNGA